MQVGCLTADLYGVTYRRHVDAKSDSCTKLFLSSVYIKCTHAFTMLSQSSSRITNYMHGVETSSFVPARFVGDKQKNFADSVTYVTQERTFKGHRSVEFSRWRP